MENSHSKNNSKSGRILRFRWIWFVAGFGVLVALILVSMPFGMDYGIERYFLANGADQVDVEDVDFNPFTRRLVVKNLIVKVDNEQVLSVSKAAFTLSWFPFFKKRFLLEKVDLNNSTIMLGELPDGRWRIGGFLPAPSADKSSASSWGLGLAELQIQDSQIKIRSSQLTSDLKIEQSRLIRLRSWLPDEKARLEFKGQLNDGKLQFQADFSLLGSGVTFDGSAKLNGLTLTPFAQLIAADPSTLQGRLDADVAIQGISSAKGFSFDQTGRLALNQARMRFGDISLADENFSYDGTVQVKLPADSQGLQITVAGRLEGKGGFVNPAPDQLAFQHNWLGWNGKFVLDRKTETADLNFDGALSLQKFKMAAPELNLAEESLLWDESVRITIPNSPDALIITAAGKMAGKAASLDSTPANFKIQGSGLNWNGKLAYATQQQKADVKLDGDLKFAKLEVTTSDALLTEENLEWDGSIQIFLPETVEAQQFSADGKLESRHQTIVLVREKLSLANENLTWKGRFNCGLKEFSAGLAAEGDLSLTELAITATNKKLRLLTSKAVNLKSIKVDTDTQFSVAAAKISGLDLVGQPDAPAESSLFSASEVEVNTIKLERRKQVSIESARIVTAKGIFHHKSDGRWLYIDDLTTFLADSGTSAPKPLQNKTVEKPQPPAKEKDGEFGIRIGSLEIIGDSVVHFEDETVTPAFRTDVRLKKARLTDVNSFKPEQSSPFTIEASSRKYTQLNLQGSVQPFGARISMDLKVKIKAAEMPPLSPYAVKTLGYNLISGEMDADIDLKITSGKLEGRGDLKFYNPQIEAVNPEKLENKKGSPIPLQSALKVLRDKNGDVRLKIPISGDATDPKFSFSDAINQALIKGITLSTVSYLKYMLGPYGTAIGIIELGAKVGAKALAGIRLNPVDFQPGASDLDPATMEYLEKVAAIMKDKKELRIRLCGWATESDRNGQRASAGIPPVPSGAGARKIKSGPSGQSVATKDDRLPLGNEEILALAERRADQIEAIMVSELGINDERIFICKPQIDENPEAKPRVEIVF